MSWSQSQEPTGSVEPAKNEAYGGTLRPSITHGSAKATATDSEDLTALVPRLHDMQSHPVVPEATGGYQRVVVVALVNRSLREA